MENTESGSLGGNSVFDSLLPTENVGAYVGAGGVVAAPVATPTIVGASINVDANPGVITTSAAVAVGGGIMVPGQTMVGGIISNGGGEMSWKKKRGRPRKYELDGSIRPGYLKSPPPPPGFIVASPPSIGTTAGKKRKSGGSPDPGSWKTPDSLGGGHITAHVLTANTGEDVAGKILTFAQEINRGGVCVLAANGTVSNATIRQPCLSGGLLTLEGRFEILNLIGSYTVCEEEGGFRSRNGGLSVTLGASGGRVMGGSVAGVLMAATPTQIVVGCFEPNKRASPEVSAAAPPILSQTATPNSGAGEADQAQAPPPCNVIITDYN